MYWIKGQKNREKYIYTSLIWEYIYMIMMKIHVILGKVYSDKNL